MKTNILLLSATIFMLTACKDEQSNSPNNYISKEVPAIAFKQIAIAGRSVSFVILCNVGDPCWHFDRTESSRLDSNIYLKIYAKRDPNAGCVAIESSIDAEATVTLPSAGTYSFHFNGYAGSSRDTTITIK
jgi:hypothetical protein